MDLYVCSTVRNFYFSVLRSIKEEKKSIIILIVDQQKILLNNLNIKSIPKYIEVIPINRKDLLRKIYKGPVGFLHKIYASFFVRSGFFSRRTKDFLMQYNPAFSDLPKFNVFLFNDRNRVARLVRICVTNYHVIEDGLSNYFGTKNPPIKRYLTIGSRIRYIGEDRRCSKIYLLKPHDAPISIYNKVYEIDFLEPVNVKEYILPLFNFDGGCNEGYDVIIATQPISIASVSQKEFDLVIYSKMIKFLESKGLKYALKVHPRESELKYKNNFPDSVFLGKNVPLELMLIDTKKKVAVLSIYSTAGMGFESYCTRITLVGDSESEHQEEIYESWMKKPELINERLNLVKL